MTTPLTQAQTMILSALELYQVLDFESTLLEVQKLVYLMQRLREPFPGLTFGKVIYGPFTPQLNHLLFDLEGRYLTGIKFHEAKPFDPIDLMAGKEAELEAARQKLKPTSRERLQTLAGLIEGFESPLGMELLATVDWVMNADAAALHDADLTCKGVQEWRLEGETQPVLRKKMVLTPHHISVAPRRLLAFSAHLYAPRS